tara:strand:+ start:281 stop:571 length:291 start_codon:yes stop_codon:yes gene_type:complete
MIEQFIVRKYLNDYGTHEKKDFTYIQSTKELIIFIIKSIINIAILIGAIVLSWDCSKNEPLLLRLFFVLIAACFSSVYVIYYAVYRVLLNNPCYVK